MHNLSNYQDNSDDIRLNKQVIDIARGRKLISELIGLGVKEKKVMLHLLTVGGIRCWSNLNNKKKLQYSHLHI